MTPLRVAQVGNFLPAHSTENELRRAMVYRHRWDVRPVQENDVEAWARLTADVADFDLIVWTRTASLSPPHEVQQRMLDVAAGAGVPTVAYHLDRWWGLTREREIAGEPFFACSMVMTADGGHDDRWTEIGVDHVWMPPAVSEWECIPGRARPEYATDVAFVGGWANYGHREAGHRPALIRFLQDRYGPRLALWPRPGEHAVRGPALRDLYASVKVVVGDSAILGREEAETRGRYWSDRVPETTGRGAYLIHVDTLGLAETHPSIGRWPMGDWAQLEALIDVALEDDDGRRALAADARHETLARHTYSARMLEVAHLAGLVS